MTRTLIVPSVDPEFKGLCRRLNDEEHQNLRALIVAAGRCDDIICWNTDGNPIVDGYSRHEICTAEGIPCGVRLMDFPDRRAVRAFIHRVQMGRRNNTPEEAAYHRGKLYLEEVGGQSDLLVTQGDTRTSSKSERNPSARKIAEETGVSEKTVRRDASFAESIDEIEEKSEKIADAALAGVIPMSSAIKLATATKATMERLEKKADDPAELRKAVRAEAAKGKRNGQPIHRARWKAIEDAIGKAMRLIDDQHKDTPHGVLHRQSIGAAKQTMAFVAQWKKVTTHV